jgi:nitrogenase molybdenum-iron protein beta chain
MGIDCTIVCDPGDVWDTPTDGEFRMYDGGTTLADAAEALHAKGALIMQGFSAEKSANFIEEKGQEVVRFNYPVGVTGTDRFIMEAARLAGVEIPEEISKERGRLVDAIADASAHLHGKRFALYGDPDMMLGLTQFLLELGAEPVHILSTNGGKEWEARVNELLASSPFGKGCKAYPGKDLWHMRSLLFTEPVDFLIGNTYGKYLERDTKTPLIRMGFPIFDRHLHHRYPTWGYQGSMNVLLKILDKIFDTMDARTNDVAKTDYSFDIIR